MDLPIAPYGSPVTEQGRAECEVISVGAKFSTKAILQEFFRAAITVLKGTNNSCSNTVSARRQSQGFSSLISEGFSIRQLTTESYFERVLPTSVREAPSAQVMLAPLN